MGRSSESPCLDAASRSWRDRGFSPLPSGRPRLVLYRIVVKNFAWAIQPLDITARLGVRQSFDCGREGCCTRRAHVGKMRRMASVALGEFLRRPRSVADA